MLGSSKVAVVCVLLMVFVQEGSCCCGVDTGMDMTFNGNFKPSYSLVILLGNSCSLSCSAMHPGGGKCITPASHKYDFTCNETTLSQIVLNEDLIIPFPTHLLVHCYDEGNIELESLNDMCPNNIHDLKCSISQSEVVITCTISVSPTITVSSVSYSMSSTDTTPSIHRSTPNSTPLSLLTPTKRIPSNLPTLTLKSTLSNTNPSSTLSSENRQASNTGQVVSILLSTAMLIMALTICLALLTLVIIRQRKRHYGHRLTDHNMTQENIYQIIDANRRPSGIIPIVTRGGECLELSEFPRYDNLRNHHTVPQMSLSKSCERGGFPMDQVPMATTAYLNGFPAENYYYSPGPAQRAWNDQNPHLEGYSALPPPCRHRGAALLTSSSHSSLTNDTINPYSTLDEARKQTLLEIKSTHTDEHSDDILMLDMFGSEKPKWTHDTRPLQLNIPAVNRNDRLSLVSSPYIHMTGDLEGGWGEEQVHGSGFDYTDDGHQELNEGLGGILQEQCNGPTHNIIMGNSSDDEDSSKNENMDVNGEAPDRSIKDQYALKTKKSGKYFDPNSNVLFPVDNNENPPPQVYLPSPVPPSVEFTKTTEKDRETQGGENHTQDLMQNINHRERDRNLRGQAAKMVKHTIGRNSHTL